MNTPPTPESPLSDSCIVCGKVTTGDRGFMTLQNAGQPVHLCCPQCYKVYQENPDRYGIGENIRDLEREVGQNPDW